MRNWLSVHHVVQWAVCTGEGREDGAAIAVEICRYSFAWKSGQSTFRGPWGRIMVTINLDREEHVSSPHPTATAIPLAFQIAEQHTSMLLHWFCLGFGFGLAECSPSYSQSLLLVLCSAITPSRARRPYRVPKIEHGSAT